jgi:CheY-like chemotaxis protein
MPEGDDIRWLQAAINELNNVLQIADESAHLLEPLCPNQEEAKKYFDFLRSSIERATKVTAQLADRLDGKTPQPEEASAAAPAAAAQDGIEIVNPQGPRELIMLIDDEAMVNLLATEMLTYAGYRVVSALDPFRALEIFRKIGNQVDLVMLDFTLPIMDGGEVFEELQRIRPNVAVMLSSGYAEQSVIRAMLARGLRGFLPKPYTEAKLLTQVRAVLDAIRSERTGERRVL